MNSNFNVLTEKLLWEMSYGISNGEAVTLEEFKDILISFAESKVGAQPISLTAVTTMRVAAKHNMPYKALYKVGQTAGMISTNYQQSVNAQRAREGLPTDFVPKENKKIARWIAYPVLAVTTTGLEVMIYKPQNPRPSHWVAEEQDGSLKEISEQEAKKYIYEPPAYTSTQGTEKQIQYRMYGLDKLIGTTFMGKDYQVIRSSPTPDDQKRLEVLNLVKDKLQS